MRMRATMIMDLNVNERDHVLGDYNAPVELVEYADYQCPYCKEAFYIIKEAQKELDDHLKFVFRNFPLTELHPNALHAAIAAEAAAGQDRFWEMHDILFENQEYLEDEDILDYAKNIGLDISRFEKDLGKEPYMEKVRKDYASGIKYNVQGTPSFFINGRLYEGNWNNLQFIEYLRSFIE